MNTTLPFGHRDPRTEVVAGTYLRLAADLLTSARQDLSYWNTTPVPTRPTDRVVFEEVRQLAVFLPLVLVAIAFIKLGFTGAFVVFLVALPVMALFNKMLMRAIRAQGMKMHIRDGGRFAFTIFMCNEFDLRPEEVTMALVLKMCQDLKLWVAIENRIYESDQAEERARKAGARKDAAPANGNVQTQYNVAAAVGAGAALSAVAATYDAVPVINPATGLPMIDGALDVHGNVFGTSGVDDMFYDIHYEYAVDTHLTNTGADFSTPGFGDFTPDFGGFGTE
ncbi:hypothetical protein [Janthinobacterium sp. 1_2014MBL_MicDiv]|uniref:hypothetical protein n=1 Tax=Janthinobacterium sp. 1_2014MBL_MicDiv TaxID=1644131 RepID=UPI0008F48F69|nr:hypothetical protein [Janthinobacterium sp. 1_2014MBL_MicDiv]APA69918.1 hypothetical protein YQ44_21385 [Janthinobacterium sp. 1_2014MBL_MicDiv]